MSSREAFEHYMRKLNPCTHLGRQKTDGTYRTVTVERAWKLWQAASIHTRGTIQPPVQEPPTMLSPIAAWSCPKCKVNRLMTACPSQHGCPMVGVAAASLGQEPQ